MSRIRLEPSIFTGQSIRHEDIADEPPLFVSPVGLLRSTGMQALQLPTLAHPRCYSILSPNLYGSGWTAGNMLTFDNLTWAFC